jgi:hypothetical protein
MAKHAKRQKLRLFGKLIGLLRGFFIFILGTLFGLYVVQWFVAILPGPSVKVTLQGLRGNCDCIYYTFSLTTNDPIEYAYLKIQFPSQINNYDVGLPQEAIIPSEGRMSMQPWEGGKVEIPGEGRMSAQVWEAGKNAKGECQIIRSGVEINTNVQASAAGNMMAIHASKLAPMTTIMGMVATTDQKSSVKPTPKIYIEGAYEYIKFGQSVRKPLQVKDRGIGDTKQKCP